MEKSFETGIVLDKTLSYEKTKEKPLNNQKSLSKKVDINVLKARVQEVQNRENKKNIIIFLFFLITLGILGVFFSI